MSKIFASSFAAALLLGASTNAAEWKPAAGPLMTRWAKDVSPDKVLPEYPRPQMVRKDWLNLNGLWQFGTAKEGEAAPTGKDLPKQILVPFVVESALSGLMERADRVWYRRNFEVPKAWNGRRVLLHFGAVDWEATVYVNGRQIGMHSGGYDGFSFDITDALKGDGQQELIVGVFDPTNAGTQPRGKQVKDPGGIFYTPSTGIWQTVWLEPVNQVHLQSIRVQPDVDGQRVHVAAQIRGGTGDEQLEVVVLDGEQKVATSRGAGGKKELSPAIPSPKLWSPDNPFLYGLRLRLLSKTGDTLDTLDSYCGMRKIEVARDDEGVPRIHLNGKFVFQMGPLDQGFWPDGLYTAPTDEALRYDIEVTKKLGFNMTRKHVKIEPARWYYWCDKLGLLVWQDMPSGDQSVRAGAGEMTRTKESAEQFERELERMVEGRFNHPSIIMWVVFNEGWGQYDTVRLTRRVKELDPDRLVNCASGWNDFPVGDVIDKHDYPGPGAPKPDGRRALVLGEFGGLGLGVDGHTWAKKTWGYAGTSSKQELTARYESLLRGVWDLKEHAGLSAAVYTQITDVETEANGFLTYDRAVIKVDLERVAAANQGQLPELKTVVETSQKEPQTWRYTFDQPVEEWFRADFDDATWKSGPGGFGRDNTPGSVVRTEWHTPEIWLRREFTLPDRDLGELRFMVHHDEDVEIYVNGVLAAKAESFTTDYQELLTTDEGRAALKAGKNILAVHCKQTGGGQYIDVGIVELVPRAKDKRTP